MIERGLCPVCDQIVRVRKSGECWAHSTSRAELRCGGGFFYQHCRGSHSRALPLPMIGRIDSTKDGDV